MPDFFGFFCDRYQEGVFLILGELVIQEGVFLIQGELVIQVGTDTGMCNLHFDLAHNVGGEGEGALNPAVSVHDN